MMTSNTQKRSKPKKQSLHCVAMLLTLTSSGCVSIRNASPSGSHQIENCGCLEQNSIGSGECGPLFETGVIKQLWAEKLHPGRLLPTPITGLAANCSTRCGAVGSSIRGWIQAKKEEANAPPWPRFHPIPTQPVFEPEGMDSSTSPEVYGRFGKG